MTGAVAATTERVTGIRTRIAALPAAVAGNAMLSRRGRHLNTTCLLEIGDDAFRLRIVEGQIAEARQGPFTTPSAEFVISGPAAIWRRFLAAEPPPGDHDLLAFVKRHELRLAGNLHPLMSHLLYFKALLACLVEGAR
ncbi:MAG: hypothetical protein JO001_17485 [Alphaproteobacteria bacterium]|nr:hypothetical protein [Alphaproteobacteria bacterium]